MWRRALIVLLVVLGVPQIVYGLWSAGREPDNRGLAVGGVLMVGLAYYLWNDARKTPPVDDASLHQDPGPNDRDD